MTNIFEFKPRANVPRLPDNIDVAASLSTCKKMLDLLANDSFPMAAHEAFFTLLLIHLNDLLAKAKAEGRPVSFADHIDETEGVANVTDLVSKLRNAVCHIRSKSREVQGNRFSFLRFVGFMPTAFLINDRALGCDFHDDVAVYYGPYRAYLRRHIARAIIELTASLAIEQRSPN